MRRRLSLDGRTRHDHAMADGQTAAIDEPFIVGGEKLMFPGDPSGSGWNIYNCRCTQAAKVKGVDTSDAQRRVRDPETGENVVVENMTYSEWVSSKENKLVKNLDLEDMFTISEGKNIDDNVIKTVYNVIEQYERSEDFFINEVSMTSIPSSHGTIIMQIEPIPSNKMALLKLNMNEDFFAGKTIDEINTQIESSKKSTVNTLAEAAIHEAGHAKLINGKSISEIQKLYAELKEKGVSGISQLSLSDGAEAIAEIEVLISRGKALSKEAKNLYEKYIGGLK